MVRDHEDPFLGLDHSIPKVGDVLVYSDGYGRRDGDPVREVTVTKVGRQYFYVDYRDLAFDRVTGRQRGSERGSVHTQAYEDLNEHRSALIGEMRRYGLTFDWQTRTRTVSTEDLETIVAALRSTSLVPTED